MTLRKVTIILRNVAVAIAVLALITQLGVLVIERNHGPVGQMIDVAGGRLHVVDIRPRDGNQQGPPLVLIHGASLNLESMRHPLGDTLAKGHRVILIDRPGHGWSSRERLTDSTPAIQATMIDEALGKLGIASAVFVVHSWAGALGAAMALDHPSRVAGLVMLAPVTHPGTGEVKWYNNLAATPVIGSVFAHLIALPTLLAVMDSGIKSAFLPQAMPANYISEAAVSLLVRPAEFMANARDMITLKPSVAAQVARYGQIKVPAVVIVGDADKIVSSQINADPFVAALPNAKLVTLQGVGHMIQNAAPGAVINEIDAMILGTTSAPRAAAR